MIYDCVIIGAGAAGMYCASRLLCSRDIKVAIIDSNHVPGKKVLLTGGGRCNLTNSSLDTDKYHSDDIPKVCRIIDSHDSKAVMEFFAKTLGVSVTDKDGLIYPSTFRSATVVNGLYNYLKDRNAEFIFDETVTSIRRDEGEYVINRRYHAKTVVIATGGASYPKTGSCGSFVNLLDGFVADKDISPLYPSLVPLTIFEKDIRKLSGARICCSLDLYSGRTKTDKLASSSGELLFTDYGISGIMVLDVSGYAVRAIAEGSKPVAVINLISKSFDDAEYLIRYNMSLFPGRRVVDALSGIIRDDILMVVLSRAGIDKDLRCISVTDRDIVDIAKGITSFCLSVTGSKDFDMAQVTTGGIKTAALDDDLQVKGSEGMFICGESLDCDGICGGYNLQFAWSSADTAARGVLACLN